MLAALAAVFALAMPALAVEDQRLSSPRAGATLIGSTRIVASIRAAQGETIQSVQARFLRGGQEAGRRFPLGFSEGQPDSGESQWAADLNPLASPSADGGAMANGTYTLQIRATSSASAAEWRGHELVLDVLPPRTTVRAGVVPEGVDVSWAAVPLPDLPLHGGARHRRGTVLRAHHVHRRRPDRAPRRPARRDRPVPGRGGPSGRQRR